jgi:hypothetical protein
MRYAALILALGFVFAPLQAAPTSSRGVNMHFVKAKAKVKKNKFNGHKAPKRKSPRTRTRTL